MATQHEEINELIDAIHNHTTIRTTSSTKFRLTERRNSKHNSDNLVMQTSSAEVRNEPTTITMHLRLGTNAWRPRRNKQQQRTNDEEINKQIDAMLRIDVIEASTAEYYSQVQLAPIPNNKRRCCNDFQDRNLNSIATAKHPQRTNDEDKRNKQKKDRTNPSPAHSSTPRPMRATTK